MAHLWEPLPTIHIPLCIYAAMEIAGYLTNLVLWCMGFAAARDPRTGVTYWLYDPQCGSARAGADGWLGGRIMHASRHQLHRLHDSFSSLMDLESMQRCVCWVCVCVVEGDDMWRMMMRRCVHVCMWCTSSMWCEHVYPIIVSLCNHRQPQHTVVHRRAAQQPIVFLHGVMGILLCLPLIKVGCV